MLLFKAVRKNQGHLQKILCAGIFVLISVPEVYNHASEKKEAKDLGNVLNFNEAKKIRQKDRCAYLHELLEEVEKWDPEAGLNYQYGLGSSWEVAKQHQRVISILRTEKGIFKR